MQCIAFCANIVKKKKKKAKGTIYELSRLYPHFECSSASVRLPKPPFLDSFPFSLPVVEWKHLESLALVGVKWLFIVVNIYRWILVLMVSEIVTPKAHLGLTLSSSPPE